MSGDDWLGLLAFPDARPVAGWADFLVLIALLATCTVIVAVDARERIIPDGCNLLVAALGLTAAGIAEHAAPLGSLIQGVAVFGLFFLFRAAYRRLRGHHGLGLGDVKFLGAAGTWIGVAGVPPMILTACAAALAWLVVARLRGQNITGRTAIPFGPFLVAGFLGVLALRLI